MFDYFFSPDKESSLNVQEPYFNIFSQLQIDLVPNSIFIPYNELFHIYKQNNEIYNIEVENNDKSHEENKQNIINIENHNNNNTNLGIQSNNMNKKIEINNEETKTGKKRGRKKIKNDSNRPKHDKLSRDNIKRKIQVNYFNFLMKFVNFIISELLKNNRNIKQHQFYPLNYKFKSTVTKAFFNKLKKAKIGDIFKNPQSKNVKYYEKSNLIVYDKVSKNNIINNILEKMYLEFFDIYYFKKMEISLSEFGLEKTINLPSELGFYKDLFKSEKNKNDEEYFYKMENCIKKDFRKDKIDGKTIFVVN